MPLLDSLPFFALALYFQATTPYQFLFQMEEFSTPLANWRWSLLPQKGVTLSAETQVKLDLASKLFALSFFLCRNVAGSVLWSTYWSNHSAVTASAQWQPNGQEIVSYIEYTAATLTRVLNTYWLVLIFKVATRKPNKVTKTK